MSFFFGQSVGDDSGGTEPTEPTALEDWERADPFANYTGATGSWEVETTTVYAGTQSATLLPDGNNEDIFRTSLTETIETGNVYRLPVSVADMANQHPELYFFCDPADPSANNYRFGYNDNSQSVEFGYFVDGSFGYRLRNDATPPNTNEFFMLELDLTEWPTATGRLLAADETELGSTSGDLSVIGPQRSSGTYGFGNDSGNSAIIFGELTPI